MPYVQHLINGIFSNSSIYYIIVTACVLYPYMTKTEFIGTFWYDLVRNW